MSFITSLVIISFPADVLGNFSSAKSGHFDCEAQQQQQHCKKKEFFRWLFFSVGGFRASFLPLVTCFATFGEPVGSQEDRFLPKWKVLRRLFMSRTETSQSKQWLQQENYKVSFCSTLQSLALTFSSSFLLSFDPGFEASSKSNAQTPKIKIWTRYAAL